ncbi:hypothetical protein HPB47_014855 [Ixodes persulcatus]|uniref:Uncharacterized protein n=1 Tax=Ixodes persulcatus TaxID=34615 RepID=A0AC60R3G3_IXOPE|nr:hypothetical protein HPB47_014855 [Ixodes persulcatus]
MNIELKKGLIGELVPETKEEQTSQKKQRASTGAAARDGASFTTLRVSDFRINNVLTLAGTTSVTVTSTFNPETGYVCECRLDTTVLRRLGELNYEAMPDGTRSSPRLPAQAILRLKPYYCSVTINNLALVVRGGPPIVASLPKTAGLAPALGANQFLNTCTVHATRSPGPEGGGKWFGEFRRWDQALTPLDITEGLKEAADSRVLRSGRIINTAAMATNQTPGAGTLGAAAFSFMLTPPVFQRNPGNGVSVSLLFYERARDFNGWDGTRREQYLCVALYGNTRKWYSTTLRETNAPTTWKKCKAALKETFGNRSMREWPICGSASCSSCR